MRTLLALIASALMLSFAANAAAAQAAPAARATDPGALEALHRHQAQSRGEAWVEWTPVASHAEPSAAIAAIAARAGAPLDDATLAAARELDALDAPLRAALIDALDAYLDYDAAAREALAQADLLAIARADGTLLPAEEADLEAFGLRVAPVLAARLALVDATVALGKALHETPAVAPAPIAFLDVLSIDLRSVSNVYTTDYAFQLDAGGSDTYLNNAGGAGIENPGTCNLVNTRPAAALVDLGAAGDAYGASNRECGRNGGATLGAGFLYDEGGNDVYRGREWGVNGGAVYGLGFLLDASGSDAYYAANVSTNGGGEAGTGLLVDLGGNDIYSATEDATNGGGLFGSGTLYDAAGNDRYSATTGGVNGGGSIGTGLLLDAGGSDVYSDQDGGSGVDRTAVPKGIAGAQLDLAVGLGSSSTPPVPSGAPTLGPDADGDGIPASASIPQSSIVVDANGAGLRPAAPIVLAIDPDDRNANNPARVGAPHASLDWGCQPDSVCVGASGSAGAAGSDLSQAQNVPVDLGVASDATYDATGHRPYAISGNSLTVRGVSSDILISSPSVHGDGPEYFWLGAGSVELGCSEPGSVATPTLRFGGIVETEIPGQTRAEPSGVTSARCGALAPLSNDTTATLTDVSV